MKCSAQSLHVVNQASDYYDSLEKGILRVGKLF